MKFHYHDMCMRADRVSQVTEINENSFMSFRCYSEGSIKVQSYGNVSEGFAGGDDTELILFKGTK